MEVVSTEAEKVLKKQKIFHKASNEQLDKLLQHLQHSKESGQEYSVQVINDANVSIQNSVKDYYNALSKLGKSIEKKFIHDLDVAGSEEAFEGHEKELNQVIAHHFIREGYFELAQVFCNESMLDLPSSLQSQFKNMFTIREAIRQHSLLPALAWAADNRFLLEKHASNLEFQLHQLKFLSILTSGTTNTNETLRQRTIQALQYARQEFSKFGKQHIKDIQKLMACIAYTTHNPLSSSSPSSSSQEQNPLLSSPYAEMFSENMWQDIESTFTREFCTLLGFSQESPLKITANIGINAIPTMIKLSTVMNESKKDRPAVEMWSAGDELPVEVQLSKKHRYHSIFSCPVSREQTCATNPPFMLTCGHVISKESLIRLCKGGKPQQPSADSMQIDSQSDPMAGIPTGAKIKCPYCPTESMATQSIIVNF